MATPMLRAGDVGVLLTFTVGGSSDLTGATAQIKFQWPDSTAVTKDATMSGRDITYTTLPGDFLVQGIATAQAKVTLANGNTRHTGRVQFLVEATL